MNLQLTAGADAKTGNITVSLADGKANNLSDELAKTVAAEFKQGTLTVDSRSVCESDGHQWGEWIVERQPSYDADGLKYRICSACGMREEQAIGRLVRPTVPVSNSNAEIGEGIETKNGLYKICGTDTVKLMLAYGRNQKSYTIPATVDYKGRSYKVAEIRKGAFRTCKKMKKLNIKSGSIKKVEGNALKGTPKNLIIQVPKSQKKAYAKLFKGKGNQAVKIK